MSQDAIDRARKRLREAARFYAAAADEHSIAELERAYAIEVGRVSVKALGAVGRMLGGVLERALQAPPAPPAKEPRR